MEKLKTVIIGLGRIGWNFHLRECTGNRGFELAGVVDPLEDRRREAEETYNVASFPDTRELYRSIKPDLVVIASPTPFHLEQILEAFEHGADVFCDKPLTLTYQDACRAAEAARNRNRKLMVYQPHRARPEVAALRDILSKGLIGDLVMIKRGVSSYVRRNDWQAFLKYGGGMLNNYGAHYIDQLLYLAESSARKVSCSLRNILSLGDAEDVVKAVIETESGVILDIDINMASAARIEPWLILGKYGSVVYDSGEKCWRVSSTEAGKLKPAALSESLAARERAYPNDDVEWDIRNVPFSDYSGIDFYEECRGYFGGGKKPFVPIEETLEVMRVIHLCREDAKTRGFV